MIELNTKELVYCLLTLDLDNGDDYVINNFVGDAADVLTVLTELTENVSVVLDCVQFDSENQEDYYCISVEKFEDDSVLVDIVDAENKANNKFYGINGHVFVADYVPDNFESDLKSYKNTSLGHIVRIDFVGNGCEDCVHYGNCDATRKDEIHTEKEDNYITQSWTDGNGNYFSRSFSSSDSKQMDKISKEWSEFADRFRKG